MTETSIQPALKSVRRALLDADVNLDVASALIDGVRRRSLGREVVKGVTAEQQFVKAMYDELLDVMGGAGDGGSGGGGGAAAGRTPSVVGGAPAATLARRDDGRPSVILLAGLQGAGKTTAAGKLALYLKEREVDPNVVAAMTEGERSGTLASRLPKRNRRVLLCAADVYRPAAIEQLEVLGGSIGVDVFSMGTDADPAEIARLAVERAAAGGYDTVVVDTAGRQVVDEELMEELRRVKRAGEFVIRSLFLLSRTTFPCFVSGRGDRRGGSRLVWSRRLPSPPTGKSWSALCDIGLLFSTPTPPLSPDSILPNPVCMQS
jgi:signal recognition particle subunit SRP54